MKDPKREESTQSVKRQRETVTARDWRGSETRRIQLEPMLVTQTERWYLIGL